LLKYTRLYLQSEPLHTGLNRGVPLEKDSAFDRDRGRREGGGNEGKRGREKGRGEEMAEECQLCQ